MKLPSSLPEWLALLETRHPKHIELGLDRVGRVWQRMALGRPTFPIIAVGGTNGKGSTCAYLDAVLGAAGYRTGLYTSPHLLRYNERVRISGRNVDDDAIVESLEVVEAARGDTPLTYFEHGTLAAMWRFIRDEVDAAVLEVGMGGRLDAVNLFDADCAVVTPVDMDHMEYLGFDREQIGMEKAGIFRAGRPAVCTDPDPPRSLLRHAEGLGCALMRLGLDIRLERRPEDWTCRVRDAVFAALPRPAMSGEHQLDNAAGAIAALHGLRTVLPVPVSAIRGGVATASQPGRFQVIGRDPLRIVDVAHNPHAARALAGNIDRLPRTGRRLGVFAMLGDKDAAGVVDMLKGRFDVWHVAGLDGPRGRRAADLATILGNAGQPCQQHPDVGTAWAAACKEALPTDTIISFGSFLTVAEVMALIAGNANG